MDIKLPHKCCDNPQRYIVAPVIGFECRNCGYRDCNLHDPLIEELAEKIADHYCKDELLKEMAEALDDLVFECNGIFNTCRPTRATYNKAFYVLQKYHKQEKK